MQVGIDLGTTNCAVHYFDGGQLHSFKIDGQELLPSSLYLGEPTLVGQKAKEEGTLVPTRLVHSAKSWLANPAALREERILPVDFDQKQVSPLEATTALLSYIRDAWNRKHDLLEEQEVVVTVPASFDEVARSLTLEAAKRAGLTNITLLEEPQAAFYAWMGKKELPLGSTILVCDIGGGTTDFSLIDVVENGFRRMAVGRHLLLGGDNIDHALAHKIGCDNVHAVRHAKEKMLTAGEPVTFFVEGKGSSIMGGKRFTLSPADLDLDGFFGIEPFEEAQQIQKSSGIKRVGLAFEAEPSFTKQLAHFLARNKKPTHLLFNGGALKPQIFQTRIATALRNWFGEIEVLESDSLDLAVSRGAAIFAAKKDQRISGGSARGFYLGLEVGGQKKALSLVARGCEEDSWYIPEQLFRLRTNQEVTFELFSSNTRLFDEPGTIVDIEDMTLLPPICTLLKMGKQKEIDVHLKVHFTSVGTLELWLASDSSDHSWKLDFSIRGGDEVRIEETKQIGELDPAVELIRNAFSPGQEALLKGIMKQLEQILGAPKNSWSPSILRTLFSALIQQADKRHLSSDYGSRFWNLAGFFIRPGYGHPLDEERTKELWKLHLSDKALCEEVELQKWIALRRAAGGLSKGHQIQLFNQLLPTIWSKKGLDAKKEYHFSEKLRCLASLELVNHDQKIKLGRAILQRLQDDKAKPFDYWALGRLGARVPLYGSL
nr:hsp70 family protein [Chlamydiota bacterium]